MLDAKRTALVSRHYFPLRRYYDSWDRRSVSCDDPTGDWLMTFLLALLALAGRRQNQAESDE